jgi:metallophosphoesterase (TIGR00282 family)
LREREEPDLIIANAENSAGGVGFTPKTAEKLFALGVDVLTGGNHSFDNREGYEYLSRSDRVLRPHNYPPGNPGSGKTILPMPDGGEMLVLNLQGRVFMPPIDCPFQCADRELRAWDGRGPVFVDMHAEATSEKVAMARFLDGRATAVIGTHTHVQTSDARILRGGCALLTDAGMSGPHGGVIGIETDLILDRFLKQTLRKFQVCREDLRLQGAMIEFDARSGWALDIKAFDLPLEV